MLDDDNFAMSFFHCRNSLIACLQLPSMIVMMALLCLTLSLCVILLSIRYLPHAEDNSAISPAVFRRCVISSQEGAFISLIALLSVFFLLSEGMSSSLALT